MDRIKKLRAMERKLKSAMKDCENKELPGIVKQYREVAREIEEIEGAANAGDEIAQILQKRGDNGKPGAVR